MYPSVIGVSGLTETERFAAAQHLMRQGFAYLPTSLLLRGLHPEDYPAVVNVIGPKSYRAVTKRGGIVVNLVRAGDPKPRAIRRAYDYLLRPAIQLTVDVENGRLDAASAARLSCIADPFGERTCSATTSSS